MTSPPAGAGDLGPSRRPPAPSHPNEDDLDRDVDERIAADLDLEAPAGRRPLARRDDWTNSAADIDLVAYERFLREQDEVGVAANVPMALAD